MTAQEYTIKEKRLVEIDARLKEVSESPSINLEEVLSLRDEARGLAESLTAFISENFKK